MPPPKAIEGQYKAPNGKMIKVPPLTDEDRRTLVRWIDLGCPVDLDYDPANPNRRGKGWMLDDNRPVLTITEPKAGRNTTFNRILIGLHDYYTGLDMDTFTVTANYEIRGNKTGENLAPLFKEVTQGVWELDVQHPYAGHPSAQITVSIKDKEGNLSKIVRDFKVAPTVVKR